MEGERLVAGSSNGVAAFSVHVRDFVDDFVDEAGARSFVFERSLIRQKELGGTSENQAHFTLLAGFASVKRHQEGEAPFVAYTVCLQALKASYRENGRRR